MAKIIIVTQGLQGYNDNSNTTYKGYMAKITIVTHTTRAIWLKL